MKIPNVSNLVKETDYDTKNSEIEKKTTDHHQNKCITTPELNKLTAEKLTSRLAQVNLASKIDVANFVKKTDFGEKLKNVTSNKNEWSKLLNKVKGIPTKELTKGLKNKPSILNGLN